MFIVFVLKTIGLPIFPAVGLTAGTYRNYAMKLFWKIMRFLIYLYYTQPFYRISTSCENHAYCIRIFTA